jgi:hypothetical protein
MPLTFQGDTTHHFPIVICRVMKVFYFRWLTCNVQGPSAACGPQGVSPTHEGSRATKNQRVYLASKPLCLLCMCVLRQAERIGMTDISQYSRPAALPYVQSDILQSGVRGHVLYYSSYSLCVDWHAAVGGSLYYSSYVVNSGDSSLNFHGGKISLASTKLSTRSSRLHIS